MPHLPAICEKCNTIFSSGIVGENSQIVIENVRSGPCPHCGETGIVPDGYYNLKDRVINVFTNSNIAFDRLKKIHDIIAEAKNSQEDPEHIINKISNDVEELKSISDILPKTKSQLYAFLGILLTIISIMIALRGDRNDKITQEDAKSAIEQMERTLPPPDKKKPYVAPRKPGRNELCPCGSGKKFKKCCGNKI